MFPTLNIPDVLTKFRSELEDLTQLISTNPVSGVPANLSLNRRIGTEASVDNRMISIAGYRLTDLDDTRLKGMIEEDARNIGAELAGLVKKTGVPTEMRALQTELSSLADAIQTWQLINDVGGSITRQLPDILDTKISSESSTRTFGTVLDNARSNVEQFVQQILKSLQQRS